VTESPLPPTGRGGGPRYIAVEGAEGAGKTTQVRALSDWLTDSGVPHVTAREPGGTEIGEAIRGILLDRLDLEIAPRTELLLMAAARSAFLQEIVRPALAAGNSVIADRSELSTLAYQGYGRGLDLDLVREANSVATGGFGPEFILVLDVDASVGAARQQSEGGSGDRIEQGGGAFLDRVVLGYRALALADPAVALIDGTRPPEVVQDDLRTLLADRFPETFPCPPR